ncbi:Senescence regulator [Artemisia annua]|uniref:Senescence regulator n=1 Tax=Artemisia annua TaxID=35608 RepID=A0A2U1PSV8_ARTAN|nr:Senescence regulator [Artemisia annua]
MASSPRYLTGKTFRSFPGDQTTVNSVADLTFEFNEFDIWNVTPSPSPKPARELRKPAREARKPVVSSVPVDVPNWSMILKKDDHRTVYSDEEEEGAWGACSMVPPHEYLATVRVASCSVHEGVGRTLKGRDLSRVRNAVWKQIGTMQAEEICDSEHR